MIQYKYIKHIKPFHTVRGMMINGYRPKCLIIEKPDFIHKKDGEKFELWLHTQVKYTSAFSIILE